MGQAMKRGVLAAILAVSIAGSAFGQDGLAPSTGPVPQSAAPPLDDSIYPAGEPSAASEYLDSSLWTGRSFYIQSDYLLYWIQGSNLPPYATSSLAGTPQSQAGVLGDPNTIVLGEGRENSTFNGGRVLLGFTDNSLRFDTVELSFFGIAGSNTLLSVNAPSGSILARPFYNTGTGMADAQLIAFPGLRNGALSADIDNLILNAELNVKPNWYHLGGFRVDCLAGFRYFQFNESLSTQESLVSTADNSPVAQGTSVAIAEQFDSENYFAAGQVGMSTELRRGIFSLEFFSKIALGAMYMNYGVSGATTVTVPGEPPVSQVGGIYANETNIGRDNKTIEFGVLPELGLLFCTQITERLRLRVGYSALYVHPLVRPGDLMSNFFNPAILPPSDPTGLRRPARNFGTSDAWVQGLNFGAEYTF